MRVALATADFLPHGSHDDQVLMAALRAAGADPVPVIWDQPAPWHSFAAIVVRSIWDYHLKYPRFLQWLAELDAAGVPVHNSTGVLRWNADKRYMLDLAQRGVRITPTRLATAQQAVTLEQLAAETGWQQLVIKPTVASTGYETWLADTPVSGEAEARFAEQRRRMDLLVQQFARGVQAGELSLVFLNGRYSHAVLKRANESEFRVHAEHGGSVESVEAAAEQIAWAESVIAAVTEPWTYARVDAVNDADGPLLMELELLDPELFFQYRPDTAAHLIAALAASPHAR